MASERIQSHMRDIKNKSNTPIGNHFNKNNHQIKDFQFQVLRSLNKKNKTSQDSKIDRLKLENHFITKFETLKPNGENTKLNAIQEPFFMVLPYSQKTAKIAWDIRNRITNDTQFKTSIAYTKYKNIKEILCPSFLKD